MLPYSNLRLILITFRDRIVHNLIRMTNDDFYKREAMKKVWLLLKYMIYDLMHNVEYDE